MTASHPLSAPEDLRDLRDLLRDARGPVSRVGRTYGDELELEIGSDRGPWVLGTQASPWALLDQQGTAVVKSTDGNAVERLSDEVLSKVVESADVRDATELDLLLRLDDGRVLGVQAKRSRQAARSPYPEPPYWEFITPGRLLVAAGPGPGWVRYPSDLPEDNAPLPGFGASDPRRKGLNEVAARIRRKHRRRLAAAVLASLSVLLQVGVMISGAAWIALTALLVTMLVAAVLVDEFGSTTSARRDGERDMDKRNAGV